MFATFTMHTMRTMSEALEAAKRKGFTCNFTAEFGGLRCIDTGEWFSADEAVIVDHRRFEGPSSEDDKEALYFIETTSGMRGTLVDAYGTYASEDVAKFLRDVEMREYC